MAFQIVGMAAVSTEPDPTATISGEIERWERLKIVKTDRD